MTAGHETPLPGDFSLQAGCPVTAHTCSLGARAPFQLANSPRGFSYCCGLTALRTCLHPRDSQSSTDSTPRTPRADLTAVCLGSGCRARPPKSQRPIHQPTAPALALSPTHCKGWIISCPPTVTLATSHSKHSEHERTLPPPSLKINICLCKATGEIHTALHPQPHKGLPGCLVSRGCARGMGSSQDTTANKDNNPGRTELAALGFSHCPFVSWP